MTPRPAIVIVLAYGAGLATGLLHFSVPVLVVFAPLGTLLWRRSPLLSLFAAALVAGTIGGTLSRMSEEQGCAARLPAGIIELTVQLNEPAGASGGMIAITPTGTGCQGEVLGRWPGALPAGAGETWRVQGQWIPGDSVRGLSRGVLLVSEAGRLPLGPSLVGRLRTAIVTTTARLYGDRAPLVDALILNRRGSLDPALRDAYAQSGLVHILSISGFHVGLIAGWLYLIGRLLRFSRSNAMLLAALTSVLYVGFIGWPAPATRAAALVVLLAVCRRRQRQVEPTSLLAVTCLTVLALDPPAIFEVGAWLSAAALWGATHFSRWSDRALGGTVGWRMLASSTGATLATAPFTAGVLGNVAVIGIGLNFVAIPLAALAVPGVLASVLLDPLSHPLAGAMAAGAGAGLNLLDGVALLGSRVPGGHLVEPAGLSFALPWAALLGFVLWSIGRRNTAGVAMLRWGWGLAVALWVSLGLTLGPHERDRNSVLTLHFLPVGQGDGAAVRTPGGHWVVIDAGPRLDGFDAGARVVVPFLRRQGVRRLSAVVVSHAHADHLGGMSAVLERFPADVVMEPGDLTSDPRYLNFLHLVAAEGIPWRPGRPGDRFELDSVSFTLLHPDTTWVEWGQDLNEDSIVLLLRYRGFEALFTGDAGLRAEPLWEGRVGHVDLLKVGHHGSRGATGDDLLELTRPKAAVISVGHNTYGHPAPETLERLARHGVPVWRTDRDGEVTVATDGSTMSVCSHRGCVQEPVSP